MSDKPSILYMGTPEFARVILERLHKEGFPILAVYAQPDKPAGRGKKLKSPEVAQYAKDNDLPLHQPLKARDPEVIKTIQDYKADFIIVAAYGKILPDEILAAANHDCLKCARLTLTKVPRGCTHQLRVTEWRRKSRCGDHAISNRTGCGSSLSFKRPGC